MGVSPLQLSLEQAGHFQLRRTPFLSGQPHHVLPSFSRHQLSVIQAGLFSQPKAHHSLEFASHPKHLKNMITALSSDSSDFVSLFSHNGTRLSSGGSRSSEAMSPSSTELSDDSSLTNDDLVVLSDLFGFSNGGTTASHLKAKRTTKTTPRSRKRPRSTKEITDNSSVLPKSQQQRQKLEIEYLKKQVVELQATVEDLQTRKLERERQAIKKLVKEEEQDDSVPLNEWVGVAKSQISAVQQLEEQNEKLRGTVAAHLGQLKHLEQIARIRYLTNAIAEPMHLTGHSTPYYSASC